MNKKKVYLISIFKKLIFKKDLASQNLHLFPHLVPKSVKF